MNLVPFNYNQKEVRVVTDEAGNPWWVAKDVCDILGLKNTADSLSKIPEKHKGIDSIYTLGGAQKVNIIDETGLYRLILRCDKPQAEPFMEWVTSEVLPTIRKTGQYSTDQATRNIQFYKNEFKALTEFAELFGISGNQALLAANKGCKNYYGIDPMAILEVPALTCQVQSADVTPTQIGSELGLSARKVNQLLIAHGYQKAIAGGKYEPEDKGKCFAVFKDTNKKHSNGTPIAQLLWKYSVVPELQKEM